MTTARDQGTQEQHRLRCPLNDQMLYSPILLALRDLRTANGRDPETGDGRANESWIALSVGMVVLDSLTPSDQQVGERWVELLTVHEIDADDALIVYAIRNALLHGYGIPKPEKALGRRVIMTPDPLAPALDTDTLGVARLSVPVFCSHLVERIALQGRSRWDTSMIWTGAPLDWTGD